jgi:cytochrome c biogenesis protein CcmG, thiol:disulfide interchange protein DsbE
VPVAAAVGAVDLPDLKLPCFTGEDEIVLRDIRGPAVINIWASWCAPCRAELPVMQALADKAGGRLTVLGVDSGDQRAQGAEFAGDKGVRMPTLFDEEQKLLNGLGRINLPVTVFLDSAGRSYVHPLPLDARELSEQVRKHTGVVVTQ